MAPSLPSPRIRELTADLIRLLGRENVLSAHSELLVYECDGFVIEKNYPDVAVFPRSAEEVSKIVKRCNQREVPFLPRGGRERRWRAAACRWAAA